MQSESYESNIRAQRWSWQFSLFTVGDDASWWMQVMSPPETQIHHCCWGHNLGQFRNPNLAQACISSRKLKTDSINGSSVELACSALLFPFKATENLTICKEINSHHKNIPTIAEVSSQVPHGVCCTTFYSEGVFCESAGLGSILSGNISFS